MKKTGIKKITLSHKPNGWISINGLYMIEGKDYTIKGKTVTFKEPLFRKDVYCGMYKKGKFTVYELDYAFRLKRRKNK